MKDCAKKQELLTAWESAARSYSDAVRKLAKQVGNGPASDYDKLKKTTELERHSSRDARKAFDAHVKEHRC